MAAGFVSVPLSLSQQRQLGGDSRAALCLIPARSALPGWEPGGADKQRAGTRAGTEGYTDTGGHTDTGAHTVSPRPVGHKDTGAHTDSSHYTDGRYDRGAHSDTGSRSAPTQTRAPPESPTTQPQRETTERIGPDTSAPPSLAHEGTQAHTLTYTAAPTLQPHTQGAHPAPTPTTVTPCAQALTSAPPSPVDADTQTPTGAHTTPKITTTQATAATQADTAETTTAPVQPLPEEGEKTGATTSGDGTEGAKGVVARLGEEKSADSHVVVEEEEETGAGVSETADSVPGVCTRLCVWVCESLMSSWL